MGLNSELFNTGKNWKKVVVLDNSKSGVQNQLTVNNPDGAIQCDNGAYSSTSLFDTFGKNESLGLSQAQLNDLYRQIAAYPVVDGAIDEIVNDVVSFDERENAIDIDLSDVEVSDKVKAMVIDAWEKIYSMLDLNNTIHRRFKSFYIDGRLAYQKLIEDTGKNGLIDIVELDVKNVRKIQNITRDKNGFIVDTDTYIEYNENDESGNSTTGDGAVNSIKYRKVLMNPASVTYVTSGILDHANKKIHSYIHKAIRPVNNLIMMENAVVIYRITRAPERRVFYIDVSGMNQHKATSYINNLRNTFRNTSTYDSDTGGMSDQKATQSIAADYYLPRGANGNTEVSTLPGASNLGVMDDVEYFRRELYKQLNIPSSRFNTDSGVQLGRATEITRDELRFSKFISGLRKRFNAVLNDLLYTELVLTGVISADDWEDLFRGNVRYIYSQDSYIEEIKNAEMLRERFDLAQIAQMYAGKYISNDTIRRDILQQTDQDIEYEDAKIKEELESGQYAEPDDGDGEAPPAADAQPGTIGTVTDNDNNDTDESNPT